MAYDREDRFVDDPQEIAPSREVVQLPEQVINSDDPNALANYFRNLAAQGPPSPPVNPTQGLSPQDFPQPVNPSVQVDQGVVVPNGSPANLPQSPSIIVPPLANAKPIGPGEAVAANVAGLSARQQIVADEAQNQANLANQKADINSAEAKRQREINDWQAAQQERVYALANVHTEEVRNVLRNIEPYDPNHWWASKSTGDKILAGIGLFLGGASGGNAMEKAIDHDWEVQKANHEEAFKKYDKLHGLNNDEYARSLHQDAARTQYRIAGLEVSKLELEAAVAKSGSQTAINGGRAGIIDLNDKITQQKQALAGLYSAGVAAMSKKLEETKAKRAEARVKLVDKGYSPEEASRAVDQDYPELAGTPWASPGQKIDAQNHLEARAFTLDFLKKNPSADAQTVYKASLDSLNKARPPYGTTEGGGGFMPPEKRAERAEEDKKLNANIQLLDQYLNDPKLLNEITWAVGQKSRAGAARWNALVQEMAGSNFKRRTGSVEPKGEHTIETMSAPYAVGMLDTVETIKQKIRALREDTLQAYQKPYEAPSASGTKPRSVIPGTNIADPFTPAGR